MSKDHVRKQAETLFVDECLTAKEIATRVKASEKTIGAWKQKFNWEEKRVAKQTSPESLAKQYDELLNTLMERRIFLKKKTALTDVEKDEFNRCIDEMSKVSAMKEKLLKDGRLSLGTHVRCIEKFMSALNRANPKLFMQLLDFNKEYFTSLSEDLK